MGSKITTDGDCSHEEIPHIQGKRNPGKMVDVARGHQRADTLEPYSQKTSQSNVNIRAKELPLKQIKRKRVRIVGGTLTLPYCSRY